MTPRWGLVDEMIAWASRSGERISTMNHEVVTLTWNSEDSMNRYAHRHSAAKSRLAGLIWLGNPLMFFIQGTLGIAVAQPAIQLVKVERPIPDEATKRDLLKNLSLVTQGVMAEKDPNTRTNALINVAYALAKLGEIEKARRTFGSAAQSAREIDDKKFRLIRLRAIIGEQAEIRDLEGLQTTSNLLIEESEKLDASAKMFCLTCKIQALNEIAKDLAKSGKISQAREKFRESLELLEGYGENVKDWQRSLGKTLTSMTAAGEFDLAFKALAAVPRGSREVRTSLILSVASNTRTSSPQADRDILERLLKFGDDLPDDRIRQLIYSGLTVARARTGDLEGALRCVEKLDGDLIKANMLGHVVGERAKLGDFEGASETIHKIGQGAKDSRVIKFKLIAFQSIAIEHTRSGDLAAARLAWDEAIRAADLLDTDDLHKAEQLAAITSARADLGDITGAREGVDSIRGDDHQKGQALVAIAQAQLRSDKRSDAIATLKQASEILEQVSKDIKQMKEINHRERNDALRPLAIAFAEAGLLDEAVNHAMAFDEIYFQAPIIAKIAVVQMRKGDLEGGLKTIGRISDAGYRAYAMGEFAAAQAVDGRAADALFWIEKLESPLHRAIVYRRLVDPFAWPS